MFTFAISSPDGFLFPTVDSIMGFAHAASFAAARRCLRFLVVLYIVLMLEYVDLTVQFYAYDLVLCDVLCNKLCC